MSCLNIRLQPAKKVRKSFTSIIQTRLHKLNKSKAIKKPNKINTNNRLQKAASKTIRPSLFLGQRRLQLKSKRRRRALPFVYKRYYISDNKAAAPVYIDKLFKDVPVSELVGYIHKQPLQKNNGKRLRDEARAEDAGASKGREISMASHMLYGVDARAEEFIASFRAEMERQEIIARNL